MQPADPADPIDPAAHPAGEPHSRPPVPWRTAPDTLRETIHRREGHHTTAEDVTGERGADLAVRLKTGAGGTIFVKAVRGDPNTPAVRRLHHEARIAPAVRAVCPALRWTDTTRDPATGATWHLAAFDSLPNRSPQLTPDHPDLDTVAHTLRAAARCRAPESTPTHPFPRYSDRFGTLATDDDHTFLRGTALVHSDPGPHTLRTTPHYAWLTNWGHATAGPPWIDAATLALRLITTHGHTPHQARVWLNTQPAFAAALPFGVLSYVRLNSALDPESEPHYRELLTYYV